MATNIFILFLPPASQFLWFHHDYTKIKHILLYTSFSEVDLVDT